jgi:hypothetical protein
MQIEILFPLIHIPTQKKKASKLTAQETTDMAFGTTSTPESFQQGMPEEAAEQRHGPEDGSIVSSYYGSDMAEPSKKEEKQLANKETKVVGRLKIVVLLVLMFSAVGVALSVFFYVRNSELDAFEESFNSDGVKVLSSLGANLDLTMEAMDSFAVSILSYARETNQTWPFVTIPDFAIRAGKLLTLSSAFYVNTYPLIYNQDQRKEWEEYTASHNQWLEESIEIQENHDGYTGPIVKNYTNWDVIHDNEEYDKEKEAQGVNGTSREGEATIWELIQSTLHYTPSLILTAFRFPHFRTIYASLAVLPCDSPLPCLQLGCIGLLRYRTPN